MTDGPAERALAHVRALSPSPGPDLSGVPVTVHFHPDRPAADGRTVAQSLAADGVYRSQFETRISNGGLTAYPGGDRDRWEHRMFGGAYTSAVGRPVYGALNLAGHPDGAAPRFGSCHLVLGPQVLPRCTFSLGDSVTEPSGVGTADTFGAVWDGLLARAARTGEVLGVRAGSADAWVAALGAPRERAGRVLDDYVEAQIHGGLTLGEAVTAVVADPSFRGTPTAASLSSLGVPLRWHPGFRLPAADFPAGLRGPRASELALAIAERYRSPVLDAAVIGRAARAVWPGFGPPAETLQLIKYLWHIVVLRGQEAGQ